MKKLNIYIIILAIVSIFVFISCEKENKNEVTMLSNKNTLPVSYGKINQKNKSPNATNLNLSKAADCNITDPIAYYTQKLANDSLFKVFVYGIINNEEAIFQNVKSNMGGCFPIYEQFVTEYRNLDPNDHQGTLQLLISYNIDTTFFLDRIAASVADGVYFYEGNQCFFSLTTQQQQQILTNVLSGNNTISAKLTWGEFSVCAVAAIGGFVAGYGGVIGQVFNMLTGGTSVFTWSDVWSISKKIVRNAVPWWAVVGTLIEFGACLWSQW